MRMMAFRGAERCGGAVFVGLVWWAGVMGSGGIEGGVRMMPYRLGE
jgi:hypothetical protein